MRGAGLGAATLAERLGGLPDVRSPAFEAEVHRQSLAIAQSPRSDEDRAFIDTASDLAAAKES